MFFFLILIKSSVNIKRYFRRAYSVSITLSGFTVFDLFIKVLILLCSSTSRLSTYSFVRLLILSGYKHYLDGIFLLENPPNDFRGNVIYKVYWIHPVVRYRNGNTVTPRKEYLILNQLELLR